MAHLFRPAVHARRSRRRVVPLAEALEARLVLTWPTVAQVMSGTANTILTGTVYDDLDASGTKTNGENGIQGWTVFLDLDHSGTLNNDADGVQEPTAATNVDGIYKFSRLIPGTYRVAEVGQPGWEATSPSSLDVSASLNKATSKVDFFNFSGGDIAGIVWNDLNGDGVRATDSFGAYTDPGMAGWTVFLDLNNNRTPDAGEPSTTTDSEGAYRFSNLPAQDYEVTEVLPAGWDVSPGFDIRQTAGVVPRSTVTQDFANFSLTSGSLGGLIWNDLNNDGVRATDSTGAFTDPGLEGWTVFLDQNRNGILDDGEASTVTDGNGNYSFISLPEGSYEVTEVVPDGWSPATTFDVAQTVDVFPGEASVAGDFANFTVTNGAIQGTVWNDLNRNGLRDTNLSGVYTDPGLAGWTILLDRNGNGVADAGEPTTTTDAGGNYQFPDLQVGDYDIKEIVPTGWETTVGYGDNYTVAVYSGAVSTAHDFANFNVATATAGSVSGVVWNDANGNGVRDAGDNGVAGWDLFADLNNNGVRDTAEPSATTGVDGSYTIGGILPGTVSIVEVAKPGWSATTPLSGARTIALKNGENATGLDFGNYTRKDASISGTVFADTNKSGVRDPGEKGLADIVVYLDLNNNSTLDAGEPTATTSADQFFTPAVDEAGTYSFTHLAAGSYVVRTILPAILSATPSQELAHPVTLTADSSVPNVNTAAVYRPTEIHGIDFDDRNGDHVRGAGEPAIAGATVYVDLNRNNAFDSGEPTTTTASDGSYTFKDLAPGAFVVREVLASGRARTYPGTAGGVLWPTGTSNQAVGNVTPTSITTALAMGQSYRQNVSITLPGTGSLANMVDVFLLFDDTGSFVNNSPIVRSAFPTIISSLQASLPGIDLGFGVGRFEEYANFAAEYATGRPFVLNQPIVAASTANFMTSIQAALNRTTPGYGGDQPETDIEALYQLVTGLGFDGNNNGSVLDSGRAGQVSTQLTPGNSGDVPSFASFMADPTGSVLASAGNVGGGGFRAGALPIILLATDTGFAYQPKGETSITGAGGLTLPMSAFTQTSRPTTPYNYGAGIQETITALNALGALVIGLGTNTQTNIDPRQGLSALSQLTGAINRSTAGIDNGTGSPIKPGDPLYFQIASGFAGSVASGVTNAIQNAVTNVAMDITIQSSDPRVKIVNHTGSLHGIGSGQAANFDIEFVGDGVPRRFDLQFVRTGTNVVLGSIPVVLGTPIPGDGYEFEDLEDGEISSSVDFASQESSVATTAPTITVTGGTFTFDTLSHTATATATGTGGVTVPGSFTFTYNGAATSPINAGVYQILATFHSADPNYSDTTGTGTLTINAATPTLEVVGGTFTYDTLTHGATTTATGVGGATVLGSFSLTYNGSSTLPTAAGIYTVLASFTSSDVNYAGGSGTTTITINAATPTISVTGGTFAYDTLTHVATATATGIGGVIVSGSFTFIYNGSSKLPANVGSYAVAATFVSNDPNYRDVTGSATITISKGVPNLTLSGGPFPYDGTAHTVVGSATNADGVPLSGTWTYQYKQGGSVAASINAGTYDVTATFVADDVNYGSATASTTLVISRVTPVFSNLSSASITSGTASVLLTGRIASISIAPTGSLVQVLVNGVTRTGSVDASGNFSVDFPTAALSAADYSVTYRFAGGTNFNAAADAFGLLTVRPVAVAGATTTALTSSIPVSVPGQSVTYTATVTTADVISGIPTGTVTFLDGSVNLGTVALVHGAASLSSRPMTLGNHTITAIYSGDDLHLTSTGTHTQVLTPVALEPTGVAGQFVLAVAGAAGTDELQLEVNRGKIRDSYSIQINASGGPRGSYEYSENASVAGRLAKILILGIGSTETVSLDTNGVAIPATFIGGPGNNTFAGGDGPIVAIGGGGINDLGGGKGATILIAGRGTSTLRAGVGETILIGGTTAYDDPTEANLAALDMIMAEWSSSSPLATRAAHLSGSQAGGLNGSHLLNGTTVHDNGKADTLIGGIGNDWFLANVVQDVIKKRKTKDLATNIGGW